MKKTTKAFIALLLSFTLIFGGTTSVAAATVTSDGNSSFMEGVAETLNAFFNELVDKLLNFLVKLFPATVLVEKVEDVTSDNFMPGNEEFLDEPAENAQWSLGYSQASIVPEDFNEGKYYKGGYDVSLKLTEMIDDLKVRVIVLDDNSGRGKTAIAAIDCLGLANADVKLIRAALADFAAENNIISINVSATHVHSGIDTQGIYTDTFKKVVVNICEAIIGEDDLAPAIDPSFLQLIIDKTAECVKEATLNMEKGKLTYAKTDAADYVRDRTEPDIMLTELYRFMFTPDNPEAEPTIISNFGVHPECIGYGTKVGTSDFVYYTEKVINDNGCNFIFLQGAVGTYTESMGVSNDGLELDRIQSTIRYGEEMGYILLGMTLTPEERMALVDEDREALAVGNEDYTPWYERETVSERELEPILNVAHREYLAPVDNGVYELLGKLSAANNKMVTDKDDNYYAVTEVGYMEIGDVKIILCPGETYAELIKGGGTMDTFELDSAYEILGTEDVLVFDLVNDALGYIMPDNFFTYATIRYEEGEGLFGLTIDSSWGLTSLGEHAASNIYGEIYSLIEDVA